MNGFLSTAAAKGRNGDTTMAHMTPGEMVVPKEVAAMRPDLVAHVRSAIAQYGVDPQRYVVGGAARRNPATGAEEFATAEEITAAYQSQLGRAPDAAGLAYWQDPANGFSATGGSFATGVAAERATNASAAPSYTSYGGQPVRTDGAYRNELVDTTQQYNAAAGTNLTPQQFDAGLNPTSAGARWGTAASPSANPAGGAAAAPSGIQQDATGASTPTGFLAATSTPAATPGAPSYNVADWYRNNYGRDGEQSGLDYWNAQLAAPGANPQDVYKNFQLGVANGEITNNSSFDDANKAYGGYLSTVGNSDVDEWAQNLYGRPATDAEIAQYGGGTDSATAQKNYAAFVAANGGDKSNLSLAAASQLNGAAVNKQIGLNITPNLNQQVDFDTSTIEGRLGNLLKTDANGNYTNDVVRQAFDRSQQTFAARGLLNSSIAAQAAQEAVISKAIEVAGPDAATYFAQSRANQDATNQLANGAIQQQYTQSNASQQQGFTQANAQQQQDFTQQNAATATANTLRQNYIASTGAISDTYQKAVADINSSAMTPEFKTQAIANAAAVRDGEMAYTNNLYSKQPSWQQEWLGQAVPTSNVSIAGITNPDTLANIINDPAQSPATRAAAQQQLQVLTNQAAALAAAGKTEETATA